MGPLALFAQSEIAILCPDHQLGSRRYRHRHAGIGDAGLPQIIRLAGQPSRFLPADFQKLKDSGITIFHPAVGYTEGDVFQSFLARHPGMESLLIDARPDDFLRIDRLADVESAKKLGKIGIVIGQQNSMHFRSVDDVDYFYTLRSADFSAHVSPQPEMARGAYPPRTTNFEPGGSCGADGAHSGPLAGSGLRSRYRPASVACVETEVLIENRLPALSSSGTENASVPLGAVSVI